MGAVADVSLRGEKLRMYTDAETLEMYAPDSEAQLALEARLDAHPLVVSLRADPDMTEARPHLKIPEAMRPHNLTGGTLMGSGRVTVPPVAWGDAAGTRYVQIAHLGPDLCGHPGVVHGGMVATLLDEGLARCCFAALPHKVGMTAYLNIQYKAPTPADAFVVLRATTTKVEGRKAWVEGRLETLPAEGEEPVVLATAEALFVSPKGAAVMAAIYK